MPEADRAFQELKHALTTAPLLQLPDFEKKSLWNVMHLARDSGRYYTKVMAQWRFSVVP
jgi:hypothetical protein